MSKNSQNECKHIIRNNYCIKCGTLYYKGVIYYFKYNLVYSLKTSKI